MRKSSLLVKSFTLAMAIMLAGNSMSVGSMGKLAAKLTGSDNTIVSEVKAAEASIFKGDYTYLQNTSNNPDPAVVPQADGNIAVAMFNDTMIQINTAANVVPAVVAASGVSAVATPTGITIAATATGTGIVQVKDTVTGKVAVIGINVVAGAGAPSATQLPTQTTQVASSAYSYADNHKIISSDGLLELNLDAMTYNSSTEAFKPVIYYGADGILTVEAWGGQGVHIPVTVHKDGYELTGSDKYPVGGTGSSEIRGTTIKINGKRVIGVGGSSKGKNELIYYSIYKKGTEVSNDTLLPIRVITLEDYHCEYDSHVPETPISLTVR